MKVLITGGAGFIGSHLAERLLSKGAQILIIDNFRTGRRDNLPEHPNLKIIEGTIADAELLKSSFEDFRPDKVVHAAASYKDPENWTEDILTNALGTAHVVQAAVKTGVKRLIYFQTALCYGLRPLEQPITLNHPIRPEGSSYALSKTVGEQYIQLSELDYVTFRLANAYGPRNLSGPLPTFYHHLISSRPCTIKDTRRDFIFIDDLLEVVLLALEGKGKRGAYHVSSGSDYSIKQLFDALVLALGIKLVEEVPIIPRIEDDVYTILLDPSKTEHDFKWKVNTPLATGVRATVQWYKAHGITETYTHLKFSNTPSSQNSSGQQN